MTPVPTFGEATAVRASDTHTYIVELHNEWCIGSVPHGGVVTSVFLRVAAAHFGSTLAAQNQPDTIILHLEFLRRTQAGPATLQVRDVKIGRQTSTIHVSLAQEGREEVVGYLTNANIDTESGISCETGWSLEPPRPSADLPRLAAEGSDDHWVRFQARPFPHIRKAMNRLDVFIPRHGQAMPSLCDEWVRFASGEKMTNISVGFVCDMWPQVIEAMIRQQQKQQQKQQQQQDQDEGEEGRPPAEEKGPRANWYPTMTLNLDVKKRLPPGGVEWLFVRVRSKVVKNGREDYEVVIMDDEGDVVALSHHVALVMSVERNLAKRRTHSGSKI
ncbi:thioesterase-like superfamily-domain-containing protein [Xylariomycetidae sp. FL2044]|nr:thioesterase-like superfamily-domain-containing protein [Xylariomycetidae sp. FL2044]